MLSEKNQRVVWSFGKTARNKDAITAAQPPPPPPRLPISLRAQVADQVTRPQQRPGVGAERRQEDGGSLHVALQSDEAHGDVDGGDVVGITLQGAGGQVGVGR